MQVAQSTASALVGAGVGGLVTQFLNLVLLWGKVRDFGARLKSVEEKLNAIGEFKLKGGK